VPYVPYVPPPARPPRPGRGLLTASLVSAFAGWVVVAEVVVLLALHATAGDSGREWMAGGLFVFFVLVPLGAFATVAGLGALVVAAGFAVPWFRRPERPGGVTPWFVHALTLWAVLLAAGDWVLLAGR